MFETLVLPASHPPQNRARFLTLSIAAHSAVIGGIIVSSLWRTGEIGAPQLRIPYLYPSIPIAMVQGGTDQTTGVGHFQRPPAQPNGGKRLFAPNQLPTEIPKPGSESRSIVDRPGVDVHDNGTDDSTGKPGSDGPGAPCKSDCGGGDSQPIQVGGDVQPPAGIFQPQPGYPELPKQLRQQGSVVLQAIIGTDGSVENMSVVSGAYPLLNEEALKSVRQWRYRPATLNGRAVRVFLTVTVNFRLY